jgi:hypothetical protein
MRLPSTRRLPALAAVLLLVGPLLAACDDSERVQRIDVVPQAGKTAEAADDGDEELLEPEELTEPAEELVEPAEELVEPAEELVPDATGSAARRLPEDDAGEAARHS